MRVLFLLNYPLADNAPWKQRLMLDLAADRDVMAVFGRSSPFAHYRAYLRRRRREAPGSGRGETGGRRRTRTVAVLRDAGIPVRKVGDVNDPACAAIIRAFRPDFVVAALDQVVSETILGTGPIFLNAHYGNLPAIRGWNASEWSLLVEGSLSVSLHRMRREVDGGEIYMRRPVRLIGKPDHVDIREACQLTAREMYSAFFRDPEHYLRRAMPNTGGRTYYFMSPEFRQLATRVAERIAEAGEA